MKLKFNTKAQLIEALEARRHLCEEADAEAVAEHKQAEKDYLATWRSALKAAAKWSYVEAKEASFRIPMPESVSRPSCPTLKTEELGRLLHILNLTHQETWTLDDDTKGYRSDEVKMLRILTLDAPAVKAAC